MSVSKDWDHGIKEELLKTGFIDKYFLIIVIAVNIH